MDTPVTYDVLANTFLQRFTPALLIAAIAGVVIIGLKGGIRVFYIALRESVRQEVSRIEAARQAKVDRLNREDDAYFEAQAGR